MHGCQQLTLNAILFVILLGHVLSSDSNLQCTLCRWTTERLAIILIIIQEIESVLEMWAC